MLERFKKELGIRVDLEESAAVAGGCCDEERARSGGAQRDRHIQRLYEAPSGAKALGLCEALAARLKPCP